MSADTHSRDSGYPLLARVYDPVMALPERVLLSDHRTRLADGLSGQILDLGSGTGAMFPHYATQSGLTVHGIEPDPHMRERAADRADRFALDIELVDASGEHLPYPDDSFDAAVVALVLCTVRDVEATLDELARVLRPGGELRFLEHVRARGVMGTLHDTVAPGWFHVAGGCNLNRQTGDTLVRDDRFELLEYDRFESGLSRLIPMIRGRLERRSRSFLPF
jgi:ubiquinone/menaquinone biosynthesis C-methylase UbiE